MNWFYKIPWQVTAAITVCVYVFLTVLAWLQPCDASSMYIGLCGAGKIIITIVLAVAMAFYGVLILVEVLATASQERLRRVQIRNLISLAISGIFIVIPLLIMLVLSNHH